VAIAGGAATINQCLAAGHIDELRLHIAPVKVGAGEVRYWLDRAGRARSEYP
jgi:dihydrofolate reductase